MTSVTWHIPYYIEFPTVNALPDHPKKNAKPFRRAVLSGLGVVLPPLLTLVVFLWAWSTIQRYILEPVEWTARSIIVWRIIDVVEQPPLATTSKSIKRDADGEIINFRRNSVIYTQIPSGQWLPNEIIDVVKKYPGNTALSAANANQYYHQFVRVQYLQRKLVVPLFICFFVILLYILGKLLAGRIGRMLLRTAEGLINRLPFVRTVYSSVKQVTDFVFTERAIEFTRVVAVQYPRQGIWSVGFVTGESMLTIEQVAQEPVLSILMPTSPMPATGFTITVCKSETVDLDISIDQAIQFVVSCGVVVPSNQLGQSAIEAGATIAAAIEAKALGNSKELPPQETDASLS
jgi:uncharacterized membrane protein